MTDFFADPRSAWRVRDLLAQTGLSETDAARELEISEVTMRRYCAGEEPVPRVVILALERMVEMRREAPG